MFNIHRIKLISLICIYTVNSSLWCVTKKFKKWLVLTLNFNCILTLGMLAHWLTSILPKVSLTFCLCVLFKFSENSDSKSKTEWRPPFHVSNIGIYPWMLSCFYFIFFFFCCCCFGCHWIKFDWNFHLRM